MSVTQAPPPPQIDLGVNPTAIFNSKTGEARVSGTYTCNPANNVFVSTWLEVGLTQRVGRTKINGFAYTDLACDGTTRPWSVDITGDNGLFKGGKAANVTVGYACGDFDCSIDYEERTVQLKGGKR